MSVGFLITSPYQIFHYKRIAAHLPTAVAIAEVREKGFGLSEEFIGRHLPNCPVEWISEDKLSELDGRFEAIICQTPILPLRFLEKSFVVAQQYSLAKERYQYGAWRAHADLNLMYGNRSLSFVSGFTRAEAVGNPLFDGYRRAGAVGDFPTVRPRLLYAPTYGSLSSLSSVLPTLSQVDADITLKLHHAEDRSVLAELPRGVEVVYSDSDPAEVLARHDGVLSDVSGAAFDALYAGLPVVVTGAVDPKSTDLARLSASERGASPLSDLTEPWQREGELISAFIRAAAKLRTTEYATFLAETYANPGNAGKAAATAIGRLIEEGPGAHFASDQVRENMRRYIVRNRALNRTSKVEQGGTPPPDAGVVGPPDRRLSYVYRKARAELAQIGPLRKAVQWRRDRRRAASVPNPASVVGVAEPRPAQRRDQVWRTIAPVLKAAKVRVARDHDGPGATVAVRVEDKAALYRALRSLKGKKLYVRVGVEQRLGKLHPLSAFTSHELHAADWIEVGGLTEHGTYQRDTSGYLSIHFVSHHPERRRYLATRTIPERPDWTPMFEGLTPGEVRVGERRPHQAGPIDVVYTWVDSRDPVWEKQRRHWGGRVESTLVSAGNDERFADRDELRHSLRSLWMFAPFVRNIYIVTADQHPSWLAAADPRVRVVSHSEIFPDPDVLPTFNSHAIEACLHRIPGLAENFVYFNDDVFLGREATESDFFTIAGMAKVRLSPSQYIYDGEPEPDAIPTDWAAYHSARLIERDFGYRFDRRLKHVPLSLKKSVLAEIEERYPEEIQRTRASRFRSSGDLAVPSMFAQYYAMMTGRAVEWQDPKRSYVYLDTGKHVSQNRFRWIVDWRPTFYCLNVTRFTQIGLAEQARNLNDFYQQALPHPAPWETDAAERARAKHDERIGAAP
ncbi:stealth conserved region 3 domain-containing protein [Stackebrandtia soli]|uniref:stealth conserved region 3 domain-containing protein n=1 Tax=Stackebrandtia soli TaxID=1892856 RepID=UPI0039EB8F30